MRRALACLVALTAVISAPAQAQQAQQAQPAPAKLLVVVSIDSFSGELLDEFRPQLRGGLARLAGSAVTSGTEPRKRSPDGRAVSVAGTADAGPAPSAAAADQRWYWNGRAFATAAPQAPVPSVVPMANAAVQKLVGAAEQPLVPPPYCQSKPQAGGNRFARAAGDYRAFETSPSLDGATLALAAALVHELRLGQGQGLDSLGVRLSATGNVERAYGSGGEEMCLQLFALDRELGHFFRALDRMKINYAAVLNHRR